MIHLHINSLKIRENQQQLIRDSHIHIEKGDRVAVIGLSGSGKTTLIRLLSGLIDEEAFEFRGKVLYDGKNIDPDDLPGLHELRGDGLRMLFQDPVKSISPAIRMNEQRKRAEELIQGHLLSQEWRSRLQNAFNMGDDSALNHRFPRQLSGGQLQRLSLLISMLGTGRILLIDEPTNSLDMTIIANYYSYLNELVDQKLLQTYLLISHDLLAVNILRFNKIILLNDQTVQTFTPESFIKTEYYKDYQSYLNVLAESPSGRSDFASDRKPILSVSLKSYSYPGELFSFAHPFSIENIHFDLQYGECLGLLGNSGQGKSTLVKCILNILPEYEGHIRKRVAEPIQYIDQAAFDSFDPHISISGHFREISESRGQDWNTVRHEVQALLAYFEMSEGLSDKNVSELSGGQRQILSYIRAVMGHPAILIADEPFTNLDFKLKNKLIQDLNRRRRKGLSLLLISHDMHIMKNLCDSFVLIEDGRMIGKKFPASERHHQAEAIINKYFTAADKLYR